MQRLAERQTLPVGAVLGWMLRGESVVAAAAAAAAAAVVGHGGEPTLWVAVDLYLLCFSATSAAE